MPLTGERKPFAVITPQSPQNNVFNPRFSPDGRWIAYFSSDSGRLEVYVAPFPSSGARWQISTNGGIYPVWRRDGKEIYYYASDTTLTAVEVSARGSEFQVGDARPLFRFNTPNPGADYDVSFDGRRFLVNYSPQDTITPITLVVNWTAEIKK